VRKQQQKTEKTTTPPINTSDDVADNLMPHGRAY